MGANQCGCFRQQNLKDQRKSLKIIEEPLNNSYGIAITAQKNIKFYHAPLYKNEALFNKFNSGNNTPQQVNISCMITKIKINLQKGIIKVKVINQTSVQLWVLCGGDQRTTITGLTLSVQNLVWCGKIDLFNPSQAKQGEWHAAKPKKDFSSCKNITIILCQATAQNSLFVIEQYKLNGSKINQKIQWNSLSFKIRDIHNNSRNTQVERQANNCLSCLNETANCIFLPCRHMCLCSLCAQVHKKLQKKCPLCKKQYKSTITYKQQSTKRQQNQQQNIKINDQIINQIN